MNARTSRLSRFAAALAAAGALVATSAWAHSLGYAVNGVNWTFTGAAQVDIPGMQTNVFAKPANQRLIVTFASECAVNAPAGNTSAWVDVDIVLINAAGAVVHTASPTVGSGDAFCASNGTAGFDGWTSNAVTALIPYNIPAGNYRVGVKARLNGGATGGWFGERMVSVSL
ncbi:MAG TPA: hypothetical protein VIO33_17190 [Burkholderiaceae bacterium]